MASSKPVDERGGARRVLRVTISGVPGRVEAYMQARRGLASTQHTRRAGQGVVHVRKRNDLGRAQLVPHSSRRLARVATSDTVRRSRTLGLRVARMHLARRADQQGRRLGGLRRLAHRRRSQSARVHAGDTPKRTMRRVRWNGEALRQPGTHLSRWRSWVGVPCSHATTAFGDVGVAPALLTFFAFLLDRRRPRTRRGEEW